MTHNTREEIEKVILDWIEEEKKDNYAYGDIKTNYTLDGYFDLSNLVDAIHQQLQKAREEERNRAVEIIKEELRNAPLEVQMTKGMVFADIIKRIQTSPVYDFFTAPEEVQRPVVEKAIREAGKEQERI